MAQTTTTLVIKSKTSDFEKGLNDSKSSFQQWTQSIDSLTGGFASKLTNALANPWTAVAGGVALATKSLAELTQAGMVGQDRLLKFSAMLGSKSEANSLVGAISELSDTSFESRDAIEAFAEKLIGAGHSADEVKDILSATIDISNTSGRGFEQVGNAIEQAFNGSSTEIERMVPSLKGMGDEAWQSGEAIKHIADELHDASVTIASGSLSNQLGAIGNSWEQIKENLGTSIVTQIQATGVLDTIANWLEKIEEHTRKNLEASFYEGDWEYIKNQAKAGGFANINEAILTGLISEDAVKSYVAQFEGKIVPFQWQRDAITTINRAVEELGVMSSVVGKTVDEIDLDFFGVIEQWRAVEDPKKMSESFKDSLLSSLDTIEEAYRSAGATQDRLENLAKLRGNITSGAYNRSEWEAYTSTTVSGVTLRTSTGYYESKKSPYEYMKSGDWEMLSESDFNKAFTSAMLSGNDDAWEEVTVYYDAWKMYKNPPSSAPTTTTTTNAPMTYADYMAIRQKRDAEYNRATNYGLPWFDEKEEEYKRDHSILGLAMQDLGLGYTPVGAETVAPNYEAFGISSLWLNGMKPIDFKLGVGSPAPRTTGGGGVNAIEGAYLSSEGKWEYFPDEFKTFLEGYMDGDYSERDAELIGNHFGYTIEDLEVEIKKIEDENTLKTIANLQNIVSAVNGVVSSFKAWGDGQYQAGEVGSGISAIGSLVSLIPGAQVWGAGISLAGAGIGLLENIFSDDEGTTSYTETEMDESYKGVVHQYQGGLELHIHNDFEGANIVGESGMGELARTIQRQIELYAYDNNL